MSLIGQTAAPAAKFKNVGDSISGTILNVEDYQTTEFADDPKRGVKKGDPKTWDDGNPKMGVRIGLDTDDGEQTLYVESRRMLKAIQGAVRNAGAKDANEGATLTVTFTGYDGPAKTYEATYDESAADLPDADDLPPF